MLLLTLAAGAVQGQAVSPRLARSAPHPTVVENRRTLELAPASSLTGDRALLAAAVLSHTVSGTVVYRVSESGSMRPLFDGNAVLLTEPAPFESLEIGDIITYRHPTRDEVVVHRILERRGEAFWTKGDHNPAMDDVMVTRDNYLQRVYAIIYGERGAPAPANEVGAGRSPRVAGADRGR